MNRDTIRQTAERLVKRYGEEAPDQASRKARQLLEQGRGDRRKDWLRIMVASNTLLRGEPRAK